MGRKLFIFSLRCLLNCFIVLGVNGIHIQAYRNDNFTGLVWESNSTSSCTNVPLNEYNEVHSIRSDTCFVAYLGSHCYPIVSEKYLPGDTTLSEDLIERDTWIGSFHICNQTEGGNQLNVDITNWFSFDVVLESYRNVCSCVNVPQYVQNMSTWSIDNHHNNMLAYYEPDCTENRWSSKFIAAGRNDDSWEMHYHEKTDKTTNTTYKIQSLGPDPDSVYFKTSCYSFEVTTESEKLGYETTTEYTTDTNTGLKNKGLCYGSEVLELKKQVNESERKLEKLQNGIEAILKRHQDDFDKLTKEIVELRQQFQNFTAPRKTALQQLFTGCKDSISLRSLDTNELVSLDKVGKAQFFSKH